jgi:isochorismate synthase/2-succinyl-5-enolpyruvyl-6-hydroxy-3-cyclohexene-1-carboxylate synthase/2-succinyl-6-hydroxy-2,4-cyclohexadiene-1-carboxylate synthase/O-succinylbenzoate synthase
LPPRSQEWGAASGGAAEGQPTTAWMYVGPTSERHDAAHLVSHRVVAAPAELASLLAPRLAGTAGGERRRQQQQGEEEEGRRQQQGPGRGPSDYARLLLALDAAAGAQVDASLARLGRLSEMHVARCLAAALPAGHGLFLGNSMPIRDMEMYGAPQAPPPPPMAAPEAALPPAGGAIATATPMRPGTRGAAAVPAAGAGAAGGGRLLGSIPLAGAFTPPASAAAAAAPTAAAAAALVAAAAARVPEARRGAVVGANRGASGIDGVLSTAAGFAQGLTRPTTLVVGDVSFLHDINGLNLLRGGEMRPPLTVVLVNNGGGGIFSFLPVAGEVERDTFERLWGTPQNVDLEGGRPGGLFAVKRWGKTIGHPRLYSSIALALQPISLPVLTSPLPLLPCGRLVCITPQACAAPRVCPTSA